MDGGHGAGGDVATAVCMSRRRSEFQMSQSGSGIGFHATVQSAILKEVIIWFSCFSV